MPRDSLNRLRPFLAVAWERSSTRAAVQPGMSRPALSQTPRDGHCRSAAEAQRLNDQRETRRGPGAGLVKVVACEGRTPFRQHADQLAALQVIHGLVFRQVGQAQPVQRRPKAEGEVVEHELPFHAHLDLAPVLPELPREHAAVGRQPPPRNVA